MVAQPRHRLFYRVHRVIDRIAAELRLWKASDQELLSPFHYFGVGGAPDLQAVTWSGCRYDVAQLSNVYTADHLFAQRVVQEVARKVGDVASMKALGFCVDIAHAEFMADRFRQAGIVARPRADAISARREAQAITCFSSYGSGARTIARRRCRKRYSVPASTGCATEAGRCRSNGSSTTEGRHGSTRR